MQQQIDAAEVARFENATWSRCADGYMDGFGPLVTEAVRPLLERAGVASGERILDLGTGPGVVAEAAAALGATPVGVDFSEAMLAEARRRHPGLELRAGSAEELPFADEEFDAVVGNFVLHHSARPDRVLSEAHRVLRPGGRTAFTVWADPSELDAFGLFFTAVEEHVGMPDLPHGPLFGVSDFAVFREMLAKARFREPRVEKLDIAWKTLSIDSFLAAFRDWADLGALPAESREAIERTVRERAEAYRRNGAVVMPNPAILLSAVK